VWGGPVPWVLFHWEEILFQGPTPVGGGPVPGSCSRGRRSRSRVLLPWEEDPFQVLFLWEEIPFQILFHWEEIPFHVLLPWEEDPFQVLFLWEEIPSQVLFLLEEIPFQGPAPVERDPVPGLNFSADKPQVLLSTIFKFLRLCVANQFTIMINRRFFRGLTVTLYIYVRF
jgi:hypothetical protein